MTELKPVNWMEDIVWFRPSPDPRTKIHAFWGWNQGHQVGVVSMCSKHGAQGSFEPQWLIPPRTLRSPTEAQRDLWDSLCAACRTAVLKRDFKERRQT